MMEAETKELFINHSSNWIRRFMECDHFLLLSVPVRILPPASVLKLAILPVKMVKTMTNDKLR